MGWVPELSGVSIDVTVAEAYVLGGVRSGVIRFSARFSDRYAQELITKTHVSNNNGLFFTLDFQFSTVFGMGESG